MTRLMTLMLSALVTAALAGCGERVQTIGAPSKKSDTKAWETTESTFAAPGYQGGDRARWEEQLRKRAQSQNDFAMAK